MPTCFTVSWKSLDLGQILIDLCQLLPRSRHAFFYSSSLPSPLRRSCTLKVDVADIPVYPSHAINVSNFGSFTLTPRSRFHYILSLSSTVLPHLISFPLAGLFLLVLTYRFDLRDRCILWNPIYPFRTPAHARWIYITEQVCSPYDTKPTRASYPANATSISDRQESGRKEHVEILNT